MDPRDDRNRQFLVILACLLLAVLFVALLSHYRTDVNEQGDALPLVLAGASFILPKFRRPFRRPWIAEIAWREQDYWLPVSCSESGRVKFFRSLEEAHAAAQQQINSMAMEALGLELPFYRVRKVPLSPSGYLYVPVEKDLWLPGNDDPPPPDTLIDPYI